MDGNPSDDPKEEEPNPAGCVVTENGTAIDMKGPIHLGRLPDLPMGVHWYLPVRFQHIRLEQPSRLPPTCSPHLLPNQQAEIL